MESACLLGEVLVYLVSGLRMPLIWVVSCILRAGQWLLKSIYYKLFSLAEDRTYSLLITRQT